jgi:hypothetical protein
MKRFKTRKNNSKRYMYGGQSPPPYMSGAMSSIVIEKLQNLDVDASILSNWASQYQTTTRDLNDTTRMNTHLNLAVNLSNKADDLYRRAQALWKSIYGSDWVPPPTPAPAPV